MQASITPIDEELIAYYARFDASAATMGELLDLQVQFTLSMKAMSEMSECLRVDPELLSWLREIETIHVEDDPNQE